MCDQYEKDSEMKRQKMRDAYKKDLENKHKRNYYLKHTTHERDRQ